MKNRESAGNFPRRHIRATLQVLCVVALAFVVVIPVACWRPASKEDVFEVREDRRGITYGPQVGLAHIPDTGLLEYHEPGAGEWLKKKLPDSSKSKIDLSGSDVVDGDLRALRGAEITRLDLSNTCITDMGIVELASHQSIESLHLANCRITNAGLAVLLRRNSIGILDVSGTDVRGNPLVDLQSPRYFVYLDVSRTSVTDDISQSLIHMKHLTFVNLESTLVTDQTAFALGELPNLGYVDVSHTRCTKAGWDAIRGIRGLRELKCGQ